MSQASNIDGVLITWGDRLFYPSNRIVKVKPQPRPDADATRLRAAILEALEPPSRRDGEAERAATEAEKTEARA